MITDRQQLLLKNEDQRFHAIGPGGTGLVMMATQELYRKIVVGFGLPSAPAMFLNIARNAHIARQGIDLGKVFVRHPGPQGTYVDDHTLLFDYFEALSVEIIFSHTAIESFANEVIPQDIQYEFKPGNKQDAVVLGKEEVERRVSLDEKLRRVIPRALKVATPAGKKVWEDYKKLKLVRDRLIHLKSLDRKSSGSDHQTIWGLMINATSSVYPDIALALIGHFKELAEGRRWFHLYHPVKA